jgi:short-subunit dehydrogenase
LLAVAKGEFGHVDVWINNAGRGIGRSVLELTDDDFDEMMNVNVKSALYGMQVAIPHFKERGQGHLINVSSFLSRVPFVTFRAAYSAAKAALNILAANLRMELKAAYPEIHVSIVMPGTVATDFSKNALWGTPQFRPVSSQMKPQSAAEVAQVIVSLIEHPQPEIYTNPASSEIARRYYQDVGAFEEAMRQSGV